MFKSCKTLSGVSGLLKDGCKDLGLKFLASNFSQAELIANQSLTGLRGISHLQGIQDKYNGIHVSLEQLGDTCSPEMFNKILRASLHTWKSQKVTAVWLKVPIMQSALITAAAQHGFQFHHAEGEYSMLSQWMFKHPSKLPPFASHQIGVSGVVLKEKTNEVLVIRDRHKPFTLWKFPGGLAELAEDIGETAEREIMEETGIKTEFQGVLAFRQQHNHPGAFGRSDLYFVCHMRPLTYKLSPCAHEIEACQWMTLDDLAQSSQTSAITQKVIQLIRLGLEKGFDAVDLKSEQYKSVYKGLVFQLFSRTSARCDFERIGSYRHSLTDEHKSDLTQP